MNKTILGGILAILVLSPILYSPSFVTTAEAQSSPIQTTVDVEAKKKELMLQLISLLKVYIGLLQEQLVTESGIKPLVLGVSTSSVSSDTQATTTPKRRSGGGGGGSSRSTDTSTGGVSTADQEALAKLQQEVDALLAEIAQLEGERLTTAELLAIIADLQQKLSDRDESISDYEDEIERLTEDIDDLEDDVAALNARIADLQTLTTSLQQTISQRNTEAVELRARIAELEQERAVNQSVISDLTELSDELKERISQLNAEITAQRLIITQKENVITGLRSEITVLEQEIVEINDTNDERVISLEEQIDALEEQVRVGEEELATQEAASLLIINGLLGNIALLEEESDELTEELDSWKEIARSQSFLITQFSNLIDDQDAEILNLEEIISDLEEQIARLQDEIDNYEEEDNSTNNNANLQSNCELSSVGVTSGATFVFCTAAESITVGKPFTVLVGVDSGELFINGAESTLSFDNEYLRVLSTSKNESDFSLWTIEPTYSNSNGTITFGGGRASSLAGTSSLLLVQFMPLKVGTTIVDVAGDSSILEADGRGTDIYVPADPITFDIGEAVPVVTELQFRQSSNNPDSTTIGVDEDARTNAVILVGEIEANEGDITLNRVVIRINTPGAQTIDVVNDVDININGNTFSAESISSLENNASEAGTGGEYVWYAFDIDGDVVILDGEEAEVEVQVELAAQNNNYSNFQEIQAIIDTETRDLWIVNGANTDDYSGTIIGNTHQLASEGLLLDESSIELTTETFGENDTVGEFTFEFELTAFEDDFYVVTNPNNALTYRVEGAAGNHAVTASISATADEEGQTFRINEGETENFTLTFTVDPEVTGTYRIVIDDLFYSNFSTGTPVSGSITDQQILRSDYQTIQN